MNNKPITILGINPGTRYIGVALFHGAELRDWRIKVVKGGWSKEKLEKMKDIIINIIEQFQPDVLAIKKLRPSRSSKNLNSIIDELKKVAQTRNLSVYEFPMSYVGAFMSPGEEVDKWKLATLMVKNYSELLSEWKKEDEIGRKWEKDRAEGKKVYKKKSYYMRMFEAVFVAYVCFRQLERGANEPFADSSLSAR